MPPAHPLHHTIILYSLFLLAMSPIAAYDTSPGPATAKTRLIKEPLRYSGSLKDYRRVEHTQAIGTEFPDLQLADILDDDVKIRDLAILGWS